MSQYLKYLINTQTSQQCILGKVLSLLLQPLPGLLDGCWLSLYFYIKVSIETLTTETSATCWCKVGTTFSPIFSSGLFHSEMMLVEVLPPWGLIPRPTLATLVVRNRHIIDYWIVIIGLLINVWSKDGDWVTVVHLLLLSWCPADQRDGPGGGPVLPLPAQFLHSGQSECKLRPPNFSSTARDSSLVSGGRDWLSLLCRITQWRAWASHCSPSCSTWESLDWSFRGRWDRDLSLHRQQ